MVKPSASYANGQDERRGKLKAHPDRACRRAGKPTKKRAFPLAVQRLFRWLGKAVLHYGMIAHGDRILVGVSGVDSLCLLWLMRERLSWIPIEYELHAAHIDLGFDPRVRLAIEQYLQDESYAYTVVKTDIGLRAHSKENLKNPCFYCSWQRRKVLFKLCKEHGFNKIALGHHLEDINATLFINIIYGGSVSTMTPCQQFFDGRVTIIRPLCMVYKEQIEHLISFAAIPAVDNPCPSAKTSQRKEVGDMLNHFYKKDRRIRYTIFNALSNVRDEYLPK